jgi:hypothetical protein
MTNPLPGSPRRHSLSGKLGLLLLVALALAPRLSGLDSPPVDAHHVRQADTANIARNMLREGIDVLHPRIDWAGPDGGYVESELPLYAASVALLWRALGQNYQPEPTWPRLISILCWLLGGVVLLALVHRRLRGPPWVYVLLYAFSPLAIVFSRNIQPDPMAVLLLLIGLERADAAAERDGASAWLGALVAGLAMGLAVAAKGTLALFLPLIPAILWARHRSVAAPRAALALLPAVLIPALWYWHAHTTLGAEGASFGLWGASAHKWGGPGLWFDLATWRAILGSAAAETLTPLGLVLLVRGIVVARRDPELRMYVFGVLLLAVGCVVLAEGFALHNYYQLPLVPFASVLCGAALVDGSKRLAQWGALSNRMRAGLAASALLLVIISVQVGAGFHSQSLRRDLRVEEVSRGASAMLPRQHSVVVADRHPQTIIYAIDRRGWHRTRLPPRELRKLQGLGAEYLLLTDTVSEFRAPEMHRYLRLAAVREASGPGWVLYWLRAAPPLQPAASTAPGGG